MVKFFFEPQHDQLISQSVLKQGVSKKKDCTVIAILNFNTFLPFTLKYLLKTLANLADFSQQAIMCTQPFNKLDLSGCTASYNLICAPS